MAEPTRKLHFSRGEMPTAELFEQLCRLVFGATGDDTIKVEHNYDGLTINYVPPTTPGPASDPAIVITYPWEISVYDDAGTWKLDVTTGNVYTVDGTVTPSAISAETISATTYIAVKLTLKYNRSTPTVTIETDTSDFTYWTYNASGSDAYIYIPIGAVTFSGGDPASITQTARGDLHVGMGHIEPCSETSKTTLGAASEGAEAANSTNVNLQPYDSAGALLYAFTRVGYFEAGDETLYGYVRPITIDRHGHIYAVGAETRVTIDVPVVP